MMQALIILQRQPLREQDWLLDVFSARRGRLSLVLNRPAQIPDLFTLYEGDWQPAQDWPALKGWSLTQDWPLQDSALFCGLYLNELLVRLLPRHEPHPSLFEHYQATLNGLHDSELADPWLRLFEMQLLQQLGYGFSWRHDHLGLPVQPQQTYTFVAGQGFVPAAAGIAGTDLLAFAGGARTLTLWRMARNILRQALDHALQQPLLSRELWLPARSGGQATAADAAYGRTE